jgi:nitrate/TMAO reductase-like tetraheme cytochrome c subunit
MMTRNRWLLVLGLLAGGALLGAGVILASLEGNRFTSSEAFCTSCHSMTNVAADPHFMQSAHRTNSEGVLPTCGDCHIPKTNWFIETYTHVTSGVRDVVAEVTHNYSDPDIWGARRIVLAHEVRNVMRSQDSVTCRSCHDAAVIRPKSEAGRAAHVLLREGRMTCVDCHFNIVHAPVPPSIEFIRGSGIGGTAK